MNGERGQASILIAIIFQVLFIFFAMVVNVGLLVHDKINLQNSVDIAAYYGAMKQAEVMNAMAQTNYQIRQAYKLLNWRLWVLADAGRNSYLNQTPTPSAPPPDVPESWNNEGFQAPVVCVRNNYWLKSPNSTLCGSAQLKVPIIKPLNLLGIQQVFAPQTIPYAASVAAAAAKFAAAFAGAGPNDFDVGISILTSYKNTVASRRSVMNQLQALLINGTNDFSDLTGKSVFTTVKNTLQKNLTAANGASLGEVQFYNSLGNNPFLVPIDVRVWLYYLDYKDDSSFQNAITKGINEPPLVTEPLYSQTTQYWQPDYKFDTSAESAQDFAQEPSDISSNPHAFDSLVGFEKNPWVMSYVYVKATTTPKMLFSPFSSDSKGQITLTAEAYAMPFGGKMGAWYGSEWAQGGTESSGLPVDGRLPPRMDSPIPTKTTLPPPNYSRYPGDPYGMQSQLARFVELYKIRTLSPKPDISDYILAGAVASDPLVNGYSRTAETQAIAPDLFDATYFSADYDFPTRFAGQDSYLQTWCPNLPCYDLGSTFGQNASRLSIENVMTQIPKSPDAFWGLKSAAHLNTSWSQGDPGHYDVDQAQYSATQRWDNTSNGLPAGGRAGYSVKLVSKSYLLRGDLPLGGGKNIGSILNKPPQ